VLENPQPVNTTPIRPYVRFSSPPQAGHGPGGPDPMGWSSSRVWPHAAQRYS